MTIFPELVVCLHGAQRLHEKEIQMTLGTDFQRLFVGKPWRTSQPGKRLHTYLGRLYRPHYDLTIDDG